MTCWINYDGAEKPKITEDTLKWAKNTDRLIIHVICEGADDEVSGQFSGVTFIALVEAIPRIGECIEIEDGSRLRVIDIFHKQSVVRNNDNSIAYIGLVVNVIAQKFK